MAKFCDQLSLIEESNRNYQVLSGFLNVISQKNKNISEELLNEAVTHSILAIVFPPLQTIVEINMEGIDRLKDSLEFGVAPIWQYRNLGYGKLNEKINDSDLCTLMISISTKPEGILVAVDILSMRLHRLSNEGNLSNSIIAVGQELILKYFSQKKDRTANMDYKLASIVKACFSNESAGQNARTLCNMIVNAFANHDILFIKDYCKVLKALALKQPIAVLDNFLSGDVDLNHRISRDLSEEEGIPISYIDIEIVINWCEINTLTRYPMLASALSPYRKDKEDVLEWTQLALKIINNSSDPIVILNIFKLTFTPMSWSGSRAEGMEKRLKLISDLKEHQNCLVSDWANNEEKVFSEAIRAEREYDLRWESDQNERFE